MPDFPARTLRADSARQHLREHGMNSPRTDYRLLPPFGVVGERDTSHDRTLTPRSLTLAAACLLLRQDLWGQRPASRSLGRLSLLGSLCLAAGGGYTENGIPAPPDEPAAAEVLASTCELLAAGLSDLPATDATSVARRLDEMEQVSTADSIEIQRLLATVHGVQPPS